MRREAVSLGGEELHYADFGGDGRAMVLVHGLGGSHVNWVAVGPRFAESRRVYALDLPGFGLSPRSRRGTTVDVMREAILRFADHVSNDPIELVGNSMGGALTVFTAASAPSRIAKAVLVCPALPLGLPFGAWARKHTLESKKARFFVGLLLLAAAPMGHRLVARRFATTDAETVVAEMLKLCCADASRVPKDAIAEMVALARTRSSRPWADVAFSEATRSIMATVIARREAFYRALEGIVAPTLIVHGREDRVVDVSAAYAAKERCPRIDLTILDGVGHTPQLEVPEHFLGTVLDWLDRQPAPNVSTRGKVLGIDA